MIIRHNIVDGTIYNPLYNIENITGPPTFHKSVGQNNTPVII
jgi:hypothetical protein